MIMNSLVVGLICITMTTYNSSYAIPILAPANNIIAASLNHSLKSITANVSSSIQSTIDKVMADTLNGMMEDTIDLLKNTTKLGTANKDLTDLKFEPNVPSGIDISPIPMMQKFNSTYENQATQYP